MPRNWRMLLPGVLVIYFTQWEIKRKCQSLLRKIFASYSTFSFQTIFTFLLIWKHPSIQKPIPKCVIFDFLPLEFCQIWPFRQAPVGDTLSPLPCPIITWAVKRGGRQDWGMEAGVAGGGWGWGGLSFLTSPSCLVFSGQGGMGSLVHLLILHHGTGTTRTRRSGVDYFNQNTELIEVWIF